jgi:hypothetical protein
MLKHVEHNLVRVFNSRSASAKVRDVSTGERSKKYAKRDALFGPMPGNCANASINRVTDGGRERFGVGICHSVDLISKWLDG